jgi:predicted O-methyltransferase YrrM
MKKIDNIFTQVDKWVSDKGYAGYIEREFPYTELYSGTEPITGIQQIKEEIKSFVELLVEKNKFDSILEIGLGHYGSTHFIWRILFNKVITIESRYDRIENFGKNLSKFYNKWVLDDGKSFFIHGNSNDTKVITNLYDLVDLVDVLFIDASHTYESLLTDWLVYSPKVKKGGLVVFHDCEKRFPHSRGVYDFLKDLELGKVDGKEYQLNRIVFSKEQGIAWYQV